MTSHPESRASPSTMLRIVHAQATLSPGQG